MNKLSFAEVIANDIRQSLLEDFGCEDFATADVTAQLIPPTTQASAIVITREAAVICGQPWFDATFKILDESVTIDWLVAEGEVVAANTELCRIEGKAAILLSAERTALNWLQSLSSTATISKTYADAVKGTAVQVLDSRKTLPGMRIAQKYAVKVGGCHNHRIGLFDAILIKENHILANGSLRDTVLKARELHPKLLLILEVENMQQLEEALSLPVDRVMLDNFSLQEMRTAVEFVQGRIKLESSGNIKLDTIREIALTGVDFISIGALTKNVQAIDMSMRVVFRDS